MLPFSPSLAARAGPYNTHRCSENFWDPRKVVFLRTENKKVLRLNVPISFSSCLESSHLATKTQKMFDDLRQTCPKTAKVFVMEGKQILCL
jgi:hypothetical protein